MEGILNPILFMMSGPARSLNSALRKGMPPNLCGVFLLPTVKFTISGITKDSTDVVLAGATVTLFRTDNNAHLETLVSDANGAYSFSSASQSFTYYIVAYKDGATPVAGTSVNTLIGS